MIRVACLAALVLALAPSAADACQCSDSSPEALPPPGSTVPPNPTILVFVSHRYAEIGFDGGTINGAPAITQRIARTPAYDVWRHDVTLTDGTFSLHLNGDEYKYAIGRTRPNELRIVGVEQNGQLAEAPGCGRHVAMDLELTGNALALRFAWEDGSSTIVPIYFHPYSQTSSASLGLLGCDDGMWNDEHLPEIRRFSLFALFADGSEQKIGASMTRLGLRGSRVPVELLGSEIAAPAIHVPPPPAVIDVAPPWKQGVAAAIGASIAWLLFSAPRLRRRREHRPRSTSETGSSSDR